MNRGVRDAIQIQAMIAEKVVQRCDRKVAEVLVIDCVELALLDKVQQIGNLDDEHAVFLEKQRNALNEAAKVGNMCEHVVGEEDVCPPPLLAELPRHT